MRIPRTTKRFRRDYAKMERSGKKMQRLDAVMGILVDGTVLPSKYKDHALLGEWKPLRDCHIEGDWILLYELERDAEDQETVTFHATDNHENLFG